MEEIKIPEKKEAPKNKENIVTLSKPYTFKEKEYTEVELNLEGLTGEDLIAAEQMSRMLGDTSTVSEYSKVYLAVVAAKASKLSPDFIQGLPARDFLEVTLRTQNFLLS